ncbi:MAG TPA: helix-turn-helix domain-containing protein [Thermaerobacter sp.]
MGQKVETLTPQEAARYLRVSVQTVYRHLRSGRLPGAKVGQQWRIRRTDLDRFLAGGDNGANGVPLRAGRFRPLEPEDEDEDDGLTEEELADAEAGWREYLEGKARPWDEVRKELTHDA